MCAFLHLAMPSVSVDLQIGEDGAIVARIDGDVYLIHTRNLDLYSAGKQSCLHLN